MTSATTKRTLLLLCGLLVMVACEPADDGGEDRDLDGLTASDGDCDDSDATVGLPPFDTPDCEGTFQRMVLNEVFGGSTCGPCAGADELIVDVLHQNEGRYVLLSYQIGSDPYVTSEGVSRRRGYLPPPSTGSYSIPWLQVDGSNGFHPVEMNDDAGYTDADFDSFAEVPSHLGLEIEAWVEGQTVTAHVTLKPGADHPSEQLVLHTAIIENTTYDNVGTNGQTEWLRIALVDPIVASYSVNSQRSAASSFSWAPQVREPLSSRGTPSRVERPIASG